MYDKNLCSNIACKLFDNRAYDIATKESPSSDTTTILHVENTSTTTMSFPSQFQQHCLNQECVNTVSPAGNANSSEEFKQKVLCGKSSKYSVVVRLLAKLISNYIKYFKYYNSRQAIYL